MAPDSLRRIEQPELIFGLAGPIGVDLDSVEEELQRELASVNYGTKLIKVTDEMRRRFPAYAVADSDYLSNTRAKIDAADNLCAELRDNSTMARIAMGAISTHRSERGSKALNRTAFLIHQLKRPEEVELLRRVYGRLFFLVSAYGSRDNRLDNLIRNIQRDHSGTKTDAAIAQDAQTLRDDDEKENANPYGQNLEETFHLGDVFVDGINKEMMHGQIHRFIHALFGRNDISPNKDEYGMYIARSASLKSLDLSRQVGAAIFNDEGLVTTGCNDAPRAQGGMYWDGEKPDYRDIKLGEDPNERSRIRLLRDLFRRLKDLDMLSSSAIDIGDATQIVAHLTEKPSTKPSKITEGGLIGCEILDVTEFGRIVHAEMCALCDAARIGRSVRGATLFCTTFPCHNCAKHILAAGISRVVYIEPYPKSRVRDLYKHEIAIDGNTDGQVAFVPFIGISPNRYRDIFAKQKRKDKGQARDWYHGKPMPMVDIISPFYIETEQFAVVELITAELPLFAAQADGILSGDAT